MFTCWSEVTQLDVLGHSARGAVTAAWVPAETLGPWRAGRNGGSAARDVWNVDSKLKRESEASTVSFALFHLASTYKETCFSSEFIGLQRQGIISYPNDKAFHCERSGKKEVRVELGGLPGAGFVASNLYCTLVVPALSSVHCPLEIPFKLSRWFHWPVAGWRAGGTCVVHGLCRLASYQLHILLQFWAYRLFPEGWTV